MTAPVGFGSIGRRWGPFGNMKKTETLNLRVSKEFKRRLQEEAKKEHRSVTNYLEFALTGLWERRSSTAEDAELPKKKTRS